MHRLHSHCGLLWVSSLLEEYFPLFFFASSFGLAAYFPGIFTQAILTGHAIAGIITVSLRIITKASFDQSAQSLRLSTRMYFWSSAFVMALSFVFYTIMMQLPYTKFHIKKTIRAKSVSPASRPINDDSINDSLDFSSLKQLSVLKIFKKIKKLALLDFITFTTTASLWPGLITAIPPANDDKMGGWFQIILIALFCVGDLIGRWLSGPGDKWIKKENLWIPVMLRLAFFPIIILQVKPYLIHSNLFSYFLAFFLPLTGGYFGGIGMIHGPQEVENHEKQVAATLMTFSLNGGIFVGSNLALLLLWATLGNIWNTA